MPLTFANQGELVKVIKVSGKPDVKKHLEDLGFSQNSIVQVVNIQGGNVIVNVKGTKLAIGKEMANRVTVENLGKDEADNVLYALQN